jgi:hypothetical protein
MPLIETLMLNVATSVGKAIAKIWLKDPGLVGTTEGVIETLKKRTDDLITRRNTGRLFQNIEDKVAERLKQLIVHEFPGLSEGDQIAASIAVGAALDALDLGESLMRSDLDATRLEATVLSAKPDAFQNLGEPVAEFGRQLLNECCNYIVRLAGALPDFQVESTAELLKRDSEILENLQRALDELAQLRSEKHQAVVEQTARFEDQYRRTLVQQLNHNQLFAPEPRLHASANLGLSPLSCISRRQIRTPLSCRKKALAWSGHSRPFRLPNSFGSRQPRYNARAR